ncbi:PleD family two-component system response regulator [Pedobacter frigiditerrae]|uniref:response regulator n=1 Tax=Pedobacter frigiditerrae TaxID=2530452 RepID=UPI00292EBE35|nr:response regulator [Pedobacter frigiditerrae]
MSKILVIDDVEDNAEVISILLLDEGHQVSTIHDPLLIWETIANLLPDLIIMDIHLLDVDGREVCKEINNNPKSKHIKVILMSASLNVFDPNKNEICADGFIPKPFDINDIVEQVNNLLQID